MLVSPVSTSAGRRGQSQVHRHTGINGWPGATLSSITLKLANRTELDVWIPGSPLQEVAASHSVPQRKKPLGMPRAHRQWPSSSSMVLSTGQSG